MRIDFKKKLLPSKKKKHSALMPTSVFLPVTVAAEPGLEWQEHA